LQQLRQQTTAKAQQLQEQLQQVLATGSSCEGACSESWRQQVQQVEQGVSLLLQQVQQFDQTYQQVSQGRSSSTAAAAANKRDDESHGSASSSHSAACLC
jgi:thiamine kinase-like enzyme